MGTQRGVRGKAQEAQIYAGVGETYGASVGVSSRATKEKWGDQRAVVTADQCSVGDSSRPYWVLSHVPLPPLRDPLLRRPGVSPGKFVNNLPAPIDGFCRYMLRGK